MNYNYKYIILEDKDFKFKQCIWCSKKINSNSSGRKFCSTKCRYYHNKPKILQRNLIWKALNPEKVKASNKKCFNKFIRDKPERFKELMSQYNQRNKNKQRARKLAWRKIKIPDNQLCQVCNLKPATQRDHRDYSKPLEVLFVCKQCNEDLDHKVRKHLLTNNIILLHGKQV